MTVLKIIGYVIAAIALFWLVVFAYFFLRMAFIDKFSILSTRFSKDIAWQAPEVEIQEQTHNLPPLPYEYRPDSGDAPSARTMLLTPSGTLEEGTRVYDSDPNREVNLLEHQDGVPAWVLTGNEVFATQDNRLGEAIHQFSDPALGTLRYVGQLNPHWFLLSGDPEGSQGVDDKLWQVSRQDFSRQLLTEDPYFTFARPPRVFYPLGFAGTVLVYYVDSVHFGFGGDSSRPKYSVVRVYTDAAPEGRDLAKLSFRAGTVVNVQYQDETLLLHADPTPPGRETPRARRVWALTTDAGGF